MIRRWTHVHSLATGLVFGLVIYRSAWAVLILGIILGASVVLGWRWLRRLAGWGRSTAQQAAHGLEELRAAEADRKRAAAEELRTRAAVRLRRASEQEAAERTAYITGARDGGGLDLLAEDRPATLLGVEVQ